MDHVHLPMPSTKLNTSFIECRLLGQYIPTTPVRQTRYVNSCADVLTDQSIWQTAPYTRARVHGALEPQSSWTNLSETKLSRPCQPPCQPLYPPTPRLGQQCPPCQPPYTLNPRVGQQCLLYPTPYTPNPRPREQREHRLPLLSHNQPNQARGRLQEVVFWAKACRDREAMSTMPHRFVIEQVRRPARRSSLVSPRTRASSTATSVRYLCVEPKKGGGKLCVSCEKLISGILYPDPRLVERIFSGIEPKFERGKQVKRKRSPSPVEWQPKYDSD